MKCLPIASFALAGTLCLVLAGAQAVPVPQQSGPPVQPGGAISPNPPRNDLSPAEMGDLYMARKMYRDAVDSYLDAASSLSVIYNKVGIAYQHLSDVKNAEKYYREALKTNPEYAEVWNNLGTLYYARKKYGDAIGYYRRALKYSPNSASIHSNMGTAYFGRKNYDEAMKEYQIALRLDPNVFEVRGTQGVLLQERSVEERAKFYFYLARAYAKSGQTELALQSLRKALESGYGKAKEEMQKNPDFAALRENPEFQQLLKLEPRVL
jgi:tetratricopeptide (TPR) repeat protein